MSFNTTHLVTGDLEENCYIAWLTGATDAVVFDPGDDAPEILELLKERGLNIGAFLLTHCHGDHIGALGALKEKFPAAPIWVPEAEVEWLTRPTLNLSYFYGKPIVAPPAEKIIRDGDIVDACGLTFQTLHVPGHSPGSTAFFIAPEGIAPQLFCGDILFQNGIGRTDLPGGSGEATLVEGIREKLFALPDATIAYPGHGAFTTIGKEKRTNPYCRI